MHRLLLLVGLVAIGLVAARAAHRFTPALNDPSPPLADARPFEATPSSPLARKVVLIVVDGLRFDAARDLPGLAGLRARGSSAHARSGFPTISKANYVTLVSGVHPRFSGARTNDGFREHAIDSLFARARSSSYVADRTRGIARLYGVEDAQAVSWDRGLRDVFQQALERSQLVVMLWMKVDEAGHLHGGDSAEYTAAVRAVDGHVGELVADLDLTRDAVVVTADHGHTDHGGHGGLGADVEDVPLVLAGAGVRAGGVAVDVSLVDVAPTVAALLGIAPPGHGTGRTLVELLDVSPAQREQLIAEDARRARYLRPILDDIDRADDARHRDGRVLRVILAVAVILAGVVLLRRRLHLAGLVLVPLFYAGIFVVDQQRLLPGVPSSASALWAKTAVYGGIALLAFVVAARVFARARAIDVVLTGVLVAATPALLAWALVGRTLATMLPSTELVIISPVAYVALTYQTLAGAIVLAMASLRRSARASDRPS